MTDILDNLETAIEQKNEENSQFGRLTNHELVFFVVAFAYFLVIIGFTWLVAI